MIPLSDASVEAAGKYLHGRYYTANRDSYWDRLSENEKIDFYDTARAAITAYLQAEIEAGRARQAAGCGDQVWCAHPVSYGKDEKGNPDGYHFPALILKLESSK